MGQLQYRDLTIRCFTGLLYLAGAGNKDQQTSFTQVLYLYLNLSIYFIFYFDLMSDGVIVILQQEVL